MTLLPIQAIRHGFAWRRDMSNGQLHSTFWTLLENQPSVLIVDSHARQVFMVGMVTS